MFQVSDDWLNALRFTHETYAQVTVTPPTGGDIILQVQTGSVSAVYQQGTRRTAQLTLFAIGKTVDGVDVPAAQVIAGLKRAGTTCRIEAGISGVNLEKTMIPMLTGAASSVSWRIPDNVIDLSLTDDWWRISQGRFTVPWNPNGGIKRVQAVTMLMQQVAPNRDITDTATDNGSVQSQGDWGVDRDQAINTLCTDGGFDACFDRQGRISLADAKSVDGPPVWSMLAGESGTLTTVETGLDVNRLYNTVVVKPSATDNSQKWTVQSASLTSGDRAPKNLGVTIPYFIASPTISSAADALRVARNRLDYVTGTAETVSVTGIGNLALDEGDIIQILIPGDELQGTPATMWNYYIDAITWDLVSGGMNLKARNQGQVAEEEETHA